MVMAGLSELNMVYEAAGMHASLMVFCLERLVIDNDIFGQCLRYVQVLEINEESHFLDVFRHVCLDGPGHYLGHAHTLSLMQNLYIYSDLSDSSKPERVG